MCVPHAKTFIWFLWLWVTSAFDCQMSMEKHEAPNVVVSAWQKKRGQAEKLEKKCPTNPFSTASQCWLKRRPSLRRRSCTTHHYHRPRSRVLLSHTKKYYHSTTPLCLFAIYHLILSSSFFCFPFWGYKAKRAAAQIVNSGWTKKKTDLVHIERELRMEKKGEKPF